MALNMLGYLWIVSCKYGMRRHLNERFLFEPDDATVISPMPEAIGESPLSANPELGNEFRLKGVAKVRLGNVNSPFTT